MLEQMKSSSIDIVDGNDDETLSTHLVMGIKVGSTEEVGNKVSVLK